MTRRSRIGALVRVAELQEAVARGAAGRALSASAAASSRYDEQLAELHRAGLSGGTRAALETSTRTRLWRAEAVADADVAVQQAEDARRSAVQGWTAARRRHRLLSDLDARQRAEREAGLERAAQRLADDLSGARRRRP